MERNINTELFCQICSLQFDKKIVYDIHLSFVHKIKIKINSEDEEKFPEMKEEYEFQVIESEIVKPSENSAEHILNYGKAGSHSKTHIDSVQDKNHRHA